MRMLPHPPRKLHFSERRKKELVTSAMLAMPFPGTHCHSVLAWPADSSAVRAVDAVSAIAKATKIRTAHRGILGNDGQQRPITKRRRSVHNTREKIDATQCPGHLPIQRQGLETREVYKSCL